MELVPYCASVCVSLPETWPLLASVAVRPLLLCFRSLSRFCRVTLSLTLGSGACLILLIQLCSSQSQQWVLILCCVGSSLTNRSSEEDLTRLGQKCVDTEVAKYCVGLVELSNLPVPSWRFSGLATGAFLVRICSSALRLPCVYVACLSRISHPLSLSPILRATS